jgi:hypothetical protein
VVIYDERRLQHEQRMYAASEAYASNHRALVGALIAVPVVAALAVALTWGAFPWLTGSMALTGLGVVAGLCVAAYLGGREALRRAVARRFGIVEADVR